METKGNHAMVVDSAIRTQDIQSKLNQIDNILLSGVLKQSANLPVEPHTSDCTVVVGGEQEFNQKRFALTEINEYLSVPATIIVENGLNDGLFIRAIEKHFDAVVPFEELLSNHHVQIDPAGGSGARSRVEYHLGIHHSQPKYLRCMVVEDGDKRFPQDTQYGNFQRQQKDAEYYRSVNVTYHVLEKRAMENYMPDEVFDRHRNTFTNEWVDAYLHLTEEQKDYYYIAEGFQKDLTSQAKKAQDYDCCNLPQSVQQLYADVMGTANYQHLLKQPFAGGHFKNSFPQYFTNSPYVNKNSLLRRCPRKANGKSELEEITEEIRQLL